MLVPPPKALVNVDVKPPVAPVKGFTPPVALEKAPPKGFVSPVLIACPKGLPVSYTHLTLPTTEYV